MFNLKALSARNFKAGKDILDHRDELPMCVHSSDAFYSPQNFDVTFQCVLALPFVLDALLL